MRHPYCPKRGDVVWITLSPQAGHEQAGRRPALVLSQDDYNRHTGLAVFCPITSRIKGWAFETALPDGLAVSGVVLSDQAKNLDWRARRSKFCCQAPGAVTREVVGKFETLLGD